MSSFLNLTGPINLPPFIIFHATGLIIVGIYQIFSPIFTKTTSSTGPPSSTSDKFTTTTINNKSNASNNSITSPIQALSLQKEQEIKSINGVAALAIGISYIATSYVPTERNQWLYASVPVRIFLAGVCGGRVLINNAGQGKMSKQWRKDMLGIILWDGLGGLFLGWWLGEGGFSGKPPVY